MNLTIKDLSATTELDSAAMASVRGGAQGNAAVPTIGQLQNVDTNVFALNGPGGAQNVFVDVDADQTATAKTTQINKDTIALGFLRGMGVLG